MPDRQHQMHLDYLLTPQTYLATRPFASHRLPTATPAKCRPLSGIDVKSLHKNHEWFLSSKYPDYRYSKKISHAHKLCRRHSPADSTLHRLTIQPILHPMPTPNHATPLKYDCAFLPHLHWYRSNIKSQTCHSLAYETIFATVV